MYVNQALVACAGVGSRLRQDGMEFPASKVFIELEGRPMLYWCLLGLHRAGVDKLVVNVSDHTVKTVEEVLSRFPYDFERIDFHKDPGFGTTGLPYHARHLLDENYFFECGHSMSEPEHYRRLCRELQGDSPVVLSTFMPGSNSNTTRSRVKIKGHKIIPINGFTGERQEFYIGLPGIFNQEHAARLPYLDFRFQNLIDFYSSAGSLRTAHSSMPLEVDHAEEWREAVPHYLRHIERLSCATPVLS